MAIAVKVSGSERFIILDPSETEKQNYDARKIDKIQIANSANKSSYIDINSVQQHYGETISIMGERKLRSIITLNTAAKY